MLTNRQLQILQVIVDDFVTTAQPVGSRQISKREGITFSPATIRNEMADLEELGYIEKTHTSSGRVPSEKGYRFYVDHLLKPHIIRDEEVHQMQAIFSHRLGEMEDLIRASANILSELTTYTAVLLGPDMLQHKVRKFQIVPLSEQAAVALVITDSGHVENRVLSLPKGFSPADIEKMVNILNDRLIGVALHELHIKLEAEVLNILKQHIRAAETVVQSLVDVSIHQKEGKIYYGGKTNMLNQPEFHDLNKVRMFMDLMDKESQLHEIFQPTTSGIQIRIGSENNHLAMENCSVITTTFATGEQQHGAIAIIGPTRMDYKRVVTLIDVMQVALTRALKK